jgi:hypothetical protein
LHLATAQHHRCDALWTNDDRLLQASHGLARNILAEAGARDVSPGRGPTAPAKKRNPK